MSVLQIRKLKKFKKSLTDKRCYINVEVICADEEWFADQKN